MKRPLPPIIDLVDLKANVLDKDAAAALPCQLSDLWLDRVADSLQEFFEGSEPESGQYLAAPLALVMRLLFAQTTSLELDVSDTRIERCLRAYRIEVALEAVNRRTDVKTTPASLDTIFGDRVPTSHLAQPKR
jgi:hypothetical protein